MGNACNSTDSTAGANGCTRSGCYHSGYDDIRYDRLYGRRNEVDYKTFQLLLPDAFVRLRSDFLYQVSMFIEERLLFLLAWLLALVRFLLAWLLATSCLATITISRLLTTWLLAVSWFRVVVIVSSTLVVVADKLT